MTNNAAQRDSNYNPIPGAAISPGFGIVVPQAGPTTGVDSVTGDYFAPLYNAPVDGQKVTYTATVLKLAVATSANVIFTLTGSATKTIRITRIEISGTCATTAKDINFFIAKYAAVVASGGTAGTAAKLVPNDSASAAASATVINYTADPTAGTLVGNLVVGNLFMPVTGGTVAAPIYQASFGNRPAQAIVLRGILEQIGISLNAENTATSLIDIVIEWTEE